jgi:hypothetical protein
VNKFLPPATVQGRPRNHGLVTSAGMATLA